MALTATGSKLGSDDAAKGWARKLFARNSSTGLCTACSSINVQSQYPMMHHLYDNLRESASKGCSICQYLLENVNVQHSARSGEITVDREQHKIYYKLPTDAGGCRVTFELFTKEGIRSSLPERSQFREVSPTVTSSESLTLLRSWIEDCQANHGGCTQTPNFSPPTRVIDVSGGNLCLRDLRLKNLTYITLSHRWGRSASWIITTKTWNLDLHRRFIDESELPQTFKDAVAVARLLEISYLWIDSLCIVQDSHEDWLAECPKMGEYYRNSYLTISALESSDSHQSFLKPRQNVAAVEIPNTGTWMRRSSPSQAEIFRKAVLNHRGWCLQERLLSTRVVHFAEQEMFWECQSCSRRESSCEVNDRSTDHRSLVSSEGLDFKRALFSVDPDKFARNGAYDVWIRLVRQFSLRELTHVSDRLPAISSLAKLIADHTESSYMVGLWQGDLHGLAWFRDNPKQRISHELMSFEFSKKAPTWSWIRTKDSVMYRFNDEERVRSEKDPVLVSTDIQTRGSDPFGSVSSAVITLRALTLSVQCVNSNPEVTFNPEYVDILIDLDGRAGDKMGTGCFDGPVGLGSLMYRCKAVRIAERRYRVRERQHNVVYFLLVQPDSEVAGRWRRVGMAMSRDLHYHKFYKDFFETGCREMLELG